jgi:hypothetical protein
LNNVNLTQTPPAGLSPQQRHAQFNNNLATAMASGDPRFNAKQYDRGGLSRGAGQWNQAGIDAAQNMSNGISDAYTQDLQNNAYNATTALQGQQAQEAYGQALGGLQQQNAYANQMAQLQRQNMATNFASSLLGGLLN